MGILKKIFATGLADILYRYGFEKLGKNQWNSDDTWPPDEPWVYICGSIDQGCIHVSTGSIPGAYNIAGSRWVRIWSSKRYKTHEEALGVLTRHVRICQDKFPHLLFYRVENNKGLQEPKYYEFLDNEWVAHPYNRLYQHDWEPLRSVVKRCHRCGHFDDGVDAYFDDGGDEKLFAYEENVSQCIKKKEFKCQQLKSIRHQKEQLGAEQN
jgi:hypothetical protein